MPNASQVRGRLVQIITDPVSESPVWVISVEEAADVEGLPNFVQPYVGSQIHVLTPSSLERRPAPGDQITVRIAFHGDERGGRFVLVEE